LFLRSIIHLIVLRKLKQSYLWLIDFYLSSETTSGTCSEQRHICCTVFRSMAYLIRPRGLGSLPSHQSADHLNHFRQASGIWLMMSDPNADGFGLKKGQMSHHYADEIGPKRPSCLILSGDGSGQSALMSYPICGRFHLKVMIWPSFRCYDEADARKSPEDAITSFKHPQKRPLVSQPLIQYADGTG
jgi:hypothetical protein